MGGRLLKRWLALPSTVKELVLKRHNIVQYFIENENHRELLIESLNSLREMWPTIENAIEFVLKHQSANGEIRWAAKDVSAPDDDALVTGCCSIYKSLECAINCASTLGIRKKNWKDSLIK